MPDVGSKKRHLGVAQLYISKCGPWNSGEVIKSGPGKPFWGFYVSPKIEYETKFNVYGLGDGLTMNSQRFNQ